LKRTVLYQKHIDAGAKMVEFGGWEMPVQYKSVIREHNKVRNDAGIFDVSHMGEIEITGRDARQFVHYIVSNDIISMMPGKIVYSLLLNEKGGAIDDLLVYCMEESRFLLVVNASNSDKDFDWIAKKAEGKKVEVKNVSDNYALMAIQGPKADAIIRKICELPNIVKYYTFVEGEVDSVPAVISRTGYTGEDGYEIYIAPEYAEQVWQALLDAGVDEGLEPCGLASRDLLRIEAGYPLYGHELTEDITPIKAGLKWAVKKDADDEFVGKSGLDDTNRSEKRIGFVMEGRAAARERNPIYSGDTVIGVVTSGTFSPSLLKAVGMGYISKLGDSFPKCGEEIFIEVRGKKLPAKVSKMPFVEYHVEK